MLGGRAGLPGQAAAAQAPTNPASGQLATSRVARLGIFVPRFTNLGTFDLVGNKIFWVGNLGSNWEYFGPVGNSEKSWEFWELSGNF